MIHPTRQRSWSVPALVVLACGAACATSATSPDVPGEVEPDGDGADGGGETDTSGACTVDRNCDDRIVCTIDHCTDGACTNAPCTDCCPEGLQCLTGMGCGPAPTPCTTDGECGDGVPCTLDRCRDATFCEHLPQNGLCEDGEICLAAIGCIPQPPESCTSEADCFPGRPCLGVWYCEPEFGCQFESLLGCDDDDRCTLDTCDDAVPGGCVHDSLDVDGDTYISDTCGGDDCDDLNPDVHPGLPEIPCNRIDDDCDPLTVENCCTPGPCTTSCGTSGTHECNPDGTPGDCLPPVETCNGVDDNCNSVCDDGSTCCARSTTPCSALGFTIGTATCAGDCSGWDTSTCGSCGDGAIDPPEQCDGAALGGSTCWTIPGSYTGGTLGCTPSCTFDASLCTRCGNMIIEPPEQCDGTLPPGATCLSART